MKVTDCRKEACASSDSPEAGESSSFSSSATSPQNGGKKRQNVASGGRTIPRLGGVYVRGAVVFKDDASSSRFLLPVCG